ncbi:MAG: hypothetical protein ABMB14_28920 [Myxococcota bacterium]
MKRIVAALGCCGGTLRLVSESEQLAAYDQFTDVPHIWMELDVGGALVRLDTLPELFRVLEQKRCSLQVELTSTPDAVAPFAEMVGFVLDVGRTVTIPELYETVLTKFRKGADESLPRLNGDTLTFTTVRSAPPSGFIVRRVSLDLRTGQVDIRDVPGFIEGRS